MKIQFPDARRERMFNSASELRRTFGSKVGERVQERLEQLKAVDCLADLKKLPGKWHPLTGNRKGQIAAHLTGSDRLIVVVADKPIPTLADGSLDWTRVIAVEVIEVVDYHQ